LLYVGRSSRILIAVARQVRHYPDADQRDAAVARLLYGHGAVDPDLHPDLAAGHDEFWGRSGAFRHHYDANLGIGLCHPPVGSIIFVGCAVGRVRMEQVVRQIWPFYDAMFAALMGDLYSSDLSLAAPLAASMTPRRRCRIRSKTACGDGLR
jgi:hypothetical protein